MSGERTHFVYEAFDADGLLLYVGCTGDPVNRYRAHMKGGNQTTGWFHPFVTHWRVSGPYLKATAFAIEKQRIAERDPIWNGHSPSNSRGDRYGRTIQPEAESYLKYHGVRFVRPGGRGLPVLVMA